MASILSIGFWTFLWLSVLQYEWQGPLMRKRDFRQYVSAGEHLARGENPFADPHLPVLTPPVMLPFAKLAWAIGLDATYVVCAIATGVGLAAAIAATLSLFELPLGRRATVALAMATSPAFFFSLHLGQPSGVYFALTAGSLALLLRGRQAPAGLLAALLTVKPHYAVALAGLAVVTGARRFLVAFAIGTAALVLLTLPFGSERWAEWWAVFRDTQRLIQVQPDSYWKKHFTFYSSVRLATQGLDPRGRLARGSLLGSFAVFGLAIAWLARRVLVPLPRSPDVRAARVGAIVVLAICSLNAYQFYYDTVLLALPGAVLVLGASSWTSRRAHRVALGCAALVWVFQATVLLSKFVPPVAGAVAVLWLALEVWDLRRGLPARSAG